MIYYNSVSSSLSQDCNVGSCTKPIKKSRLLPSWILPLDCWIEIKVDASRRRTTGSIIIGYVMKDKYSTTLILEGKQISGCSILLSVYFQEPVMIASQKNLQKVIIESDFQLVLILFMVKYLFKKKIINLVKDIRKLSPVT